MGSWYGTKIGLKVNESEEDRANEFLTLLGLKLIDDMDEEIGALSDLDDYTVIGTAENNVLDLMPVLEKKFAAYQNQFYGKRFKEVPCPQLDDLYRVVKKLFPRAGMLLAHEEGNSVSDNYYRYEVIYNAGKKTELNCFYSYGDGINCETDNPRSEGIEKSEVKLTAGKPDSALISMLTEKAEAEGFSELALMLKGKSDETGKAASGKKETIKQIPGLKVVKNRVVKYSGSARTLEIPEGITEIGDEAFSSNQTIKKISFPDSLERIGKKAFRYCSNLSEAVLSKNLSYIGAEAFSYCKKLTEIVVPEMIERIEEKTFSYCEKLCRVILPAGLSEIGDNAFEWCDKLETVNLPAGIRKIGACAFNVCRKLTDLVLPEGLLEIGRGAFSICKMLSKIVIPESVISLGGNLMGGNMCDTVTEIHVINLEFLLKTTEKSDFCPATCNAKLMIDNTLLEDVVLPSGLTTISKGFFAGYKYLKKITIPESVTDISWHAFSGCSNLEKVTAPKALQSGIKMSCAFSGCEKLAEIQYI